MWILEIKSTDVFKGFLSIAGFGFWSVIRMFIDFFDHDEIFVFGQHCLQKTVFFFNKEK